MNCSSRELLETHDIAKSKQQKTPNPSDSCNMPPRRRYDDTYVEINSDLKLNINIYNALVAKPHI